MFSKSSLKLPFLSLPILPLMLPKDRESDSMKKGRLRPTKITELLRVMTRLVKIRFIQLFSSERDDASE